MLNVKSLTVVDDGWPECLTGVDPVPEHLYWAGVDIASWINRPRLAVVGSRRAGGYGRGITEHWVLQLAAEGVVIISGLALGIDGLAHAAALKAGGITVAVLGTGLNQIYPASHFGLARQIVESGGTLISEYPSGTPGLRHNFIARNRLIAGLSEAVLITEAATGSGSLHTARFAMEQGKTVMALPGDITRLNSAGCNQLIKSGALIVTSVDDVRLALGLSGRQVRRRKLPTDAVELEILRLIEKGVRDQEEICQRANLSASVINSALTTLELGGYIRPLGAGEWSII